MLINISNHVQVKNPTETLLTWMKKNLIVSNPEYAKKQRMGFWTGNTPRELNFYEQVKDAFILPYGCKDIMPKTDSDIIINTFTPHSEVGYDTCKVPLYDYQNTAVKNMMCRGYGILQAPAGSGKTQMGIAMAIRHNKPTLWICHTKDLLNQSMERALQYIPDKFLGTITEGKINIANGITFATVQTLSKINLLDYRDMWEVVIVDECHRVAGSPTSITQYYKTLSMIAAPHKYGLSATVHRADGLLLGLYSLLGNVTHIVSEEEVKDKIVKVGVMVKSTGLQISREALNTDGTLNYQKLIGYICDNEQRNELIVQDIIDNKDKSCLILSDRLNHLATLMEMLPTDMKENAVMISGKMSTKKGKTERTQAIKDLRTGEKKYLFATYPLAKEGLDIPRLERLFMTTPQKDYAVVTQAIGRIARRFNGKENPIAYDYVDDIHYTVKAYKSRLKTYKKIGCELCE